MLFSLFSVTFYCSSFVILICILIYISTLILPLKRIDFVDQFLYKVAKELFSWINSIAAINEKYSDIVKVQNFGFFALSIGPLRISSLEKFVTYATQQRKESENRYVLWMVSYTFPALSVLAARMDGVGSRVREEELALYVRRYVTP